ncbi:MAG: phosphoserine phosphatase [Candidatus Thermoplasmatota archaeon]|nr:phosphoserine phosphatase [Candidatus Thermoplasmatota archaeon]
MTELLSELVEKRNQADAQADLHRHKRDELNEKTRDWIQKRDSLNARVRELVEEATQHKAERDGLNKEVQEAKIEREKWNRKVAELLGELGRLRRRKVPKGGISIDKLRRDLRSLEFRQQTSVLAVDKERDLIEQIARLQADIVKMERQLQEDEEVREHQQRIDEAKKMAESCHREVSRLAEEAQIDHDAMLALYEKGDETRRTADRAQEEFIKTKMLADERHQKHIEFIRQVRDYDKIIHGIRAKDRQSRVKKEEVSAKKEAELIYGKFKKGEKLSTEDLMILQKSGYL